MEFGLHNYKFNLRICLDEETFSNHYTSISIELLYLDFQTSICATKGKNKPKGSSINHVDMEGGRGKGVSSMSILSKMIHRGGGGQKCLKNCRHGLWIDLHEHKKS